MTAWWGGRWLLTAALILAGLSGWCDEPDLSSYARRQYAEAREKYRSAPENVELAWQFARACFDRAEFATNSTERALIAEEGLAACRQALERAPASAPARYYLGMNLGQLARTKGIGALKLVNQMEREFQTVRQEDATIDYGGPDRNLGLLYRETPIIASIGSRSKAKHHLQQAAALAPTYLDNRLNLAESYLRWGDRNGALREWKAVEELWEKARAEFSGEAWASTWADWSIRREQLRSQVTTEPRSLKSPRA